MTKDEILTEVSTGTGVTKADVEKVLDDFFGLVIERAAEAQETAYPKIGKFVGVHQAAKTARNPATGEDIAVPAKVVLKFKVGAKVKRQVNSEE